ncbi:hypothetical protein ANN_06682 [Periplaneta americana]|uniref:Tc1-like transposase DDE domain-containing protein n=1 Tax=Periplaneta americana TaxID=6978 RepID=A0ABQ8TGS0_PERAM|nr:hypothetical protein ANN_06682 [Periplaneta americana]
MRHFNAFEVYHALLLLRQGQSFRQVAKELEVSPSVVSRVRNMHREIGQYCKRPGQGCKCKTSPQDDRYIVLSALRQRKKTARDLQNDLYMASEIRVSYQTDNARAHSEAVTRDFLRGNEIEVMEWSAISPDLNATEHLWDVLDRKVRNRHQAPQTLQELGDALKKE